MTETAIQRLLCRSLVRMKEEHLREGLKKTRLLSEVREQMDTISEGQQVIMREYEVSEDLIE